MYCRTIQGAKLSVLPLPSFTIADIFANANAVNISNHIIYG